MSDEQWRQFFLICIRVLGAGERFDWASSSWCGWITFSKLEAGILSYWSAGLPREADLGDIGTNDSGPWGQPFHYSDLAHILIPREFYWEKTGTPDFHNGTRKQDVDRLSRELNEAGIAHRTTDLLLEIKLY